MSDTEPQLVAGRQPAGKKLRLNLFKGVSMAVKKITFQIKQTD